MGTGSSSIEVFEKTFKFNFRRNRLSCVFVIRARKSSLHNFNTIFTISSFVASKTEKEVVLNEIRGSELIPIKVKNLHKIGY